MPVQKFIRVEGVGRFENLRPSGDVQLRDITLIYGDNGAGKTTLAGILRSLATGDPAYVEERATLGHGTPPSVQILLSTGVAAFSNSAWSRTSPDVEVFDTTFVNENVYLGDRVDVGHRKNLYEVVVGGAAVALAERNDAIDTDSRAVARQLADAEKELRKQIQSPFSLTDFLALQPEDGLKESKAQATSKLAAARKAKEIVKRPQLSELKMPPAPSTVVEILGTEIEDVSADAEGRVQEHVQKQLDHRGEQWLRQGLGYVRSERCPFCSQSLSSTEQIDLYKQYFSRAYNEHVVAVQRAVDDLAQGFGEDVLARLQRVALANNGCIDTWADLSDLTYARTSMDAFEKAWRHLTAVLADALKRKQENPGEPHGDASKIAAALEGYGERLAELETHNEAIRRANDDIAKLKTDAAAADEGLLEAELRRLRNIEIRLTDDVEDLCEKYAAATKRKKELETAKAENRKNLVAQATTLLGDYQEELNDLLTNFGASFSIVGTKPSFSGGKASSTYKLRVNDTELKLGDSRTPRGTPCFRTALSAGDKSALGLAFFLAKLRRDPKLGEKVVVIDDPLSSLDCFRESFTQQEISRIADQAVQVIVLSHKPFFLKSIFDSRPAGQVKALRLRRTGTGYSMEPWAIDEYCLTAAHKDFFVLKSFLDEGLPRGGDLLTVARSLRPCLEGNLRHRFPDEFSGHMVGEFIKKVNEADATHVLARLKPQMTELNDINEYARKFHHSGSTATTTESELRAYVTRLMEFVRG